MAYHPPDITLHYPYLRRMSWAQITAAAEDAEIHHVDWPPESPDNQYHLNK
ncbi:hypothetical protein ACXN2V_005314 [Escherichia coli]